MNCTTEACMMELLWEYMDLPPPMKEVKVQIVKALPRPDNPIPNLKETILEWLQSEPESGSLLAVSSQPHVQTQHALLKRVLFGWNVVTIGPQVGDRFWNDSSHQFFDAAARHIYAAV